MAHSGSTDTNGLAALSRMQEPPPGSRLDHFPDHEVHEFYQGFVRVLHRRSRSVENSISVFACKLC